MPEEKKVAFDYKQFEQKWTQKWEADRIYRADDASDKPKRYHLVEFPYPSGPGMHMGHCRNFTMFDVLSRYYRAKGFNVLYPMGWDAFGLPTFNYALKSGKNPHQVSKENVANFKKQLQSLGLSFDWSREIDTTDPKYYKWTQWIFVQFFNHWYDAEQQKPRPISELPIPADVQKKGPEAVNQYQNSYRLAFKDKMPINWCPSCKTGLANEEVVDGNKCERCGHEVEQRVIEQWLLRITAYADRLADDLESVDFPEWVKISQRNWIGRSEGMEITFQVPNTKFQITAFTTAYDTLFGVTFMVIAPEHPLVKELLAIAKNPEEIKAYVAEARTKTDVDRQSQKEKTGVRIEGVDITHPVTGKALPLFVADYVLNEYGTGAVMGVPAHDERDYEFAKKYTIDIVSVVKDSEEFLSFRGDIKAESEKYSVQNSGEFDGMTFKDARKKMAESFAKAGFAEHKVMHKMRDWIFSRQHYWGEPIPIVYVEGEGYVAVSEEQLPVELPMLDNYHPTDEGGSPLEKAPEWRQVTLSDGRKAIRETDVMPNWAGSSWYFLRYTDPHNDSTFADPEKMKKWLMVDHYEGGQEHVTLHLLYSRFWHKFLYDLGKVPTPEPYAKRTIHGVVLATDGKKMSKSLGNIVVPDELVNVYGGDITRLGVMFMGGYEDTFPWNTRAMDGVRRFANKFYVYVMKNSAQPAAETQPEVVAALNDLGNLVAKDIERLGFNSAIAKIMEFYNEFKDHGLTKDQIKQLLIVASVFMPFMTEEVWSQIGEKGSVHKQQWPTYDPSLSQKSTVEIVVQVSGKVRGRVTVAVDASQDEVVGTASKEAWYQTYVGTQEPKKVIFVPNKVLNVVV